MASSVFFHDPSGGGSQSHLTIAELDEIDHALIDALFVDGRASYAALGDIVGLSRSSARARVMRLFDRDIIVVHGRVDPAALGTAVFAHVLIRTIGSTRAVADQLAGIEAAELVTETAGSWDVVVAVRCRDADHLASTLEAIRSCPGVASIDSSTILRFLKQRWSSSAVDPTAKEIIDLDDLDLQLVDALQVDGRASYASLAALIDQPESSTRERVVRLLDSGTVEVRVIPGLAIYELCEFVGVLVDVDGPTAAVADALVAFDETTVVAEVSGRHALAVEAWSPVATHLGGLLERVHSVPGVTGVDTLLFTHTNRFGDRMPRPS